LGWIVGDEIILKNAKENGFDIADSNQGIGGSSLIADQITAYDRDHAGPSPNYQINNFVPIQMYTNRLYNSDGSTPSPNTIESAGSVIENNPQLVAYNKTLAEDPSRHPANAFKANTTYHFQYMYDETKINPPEYIYWVLRIPASMDSHNGESLI
jgi:hypothetical protein